MGTKEVTLTSTLTSKVSEDGCVEQASSEKKSSVITSEPIEQEKEEEEEEEVVMIRPSSVTMSDMEEENEDQRGKDENTNNVREESKITSLAKTRPSFTKKRPSSSIGRSF